MENRLYKNLVKRFIGGTTLSLLFLMSFLFYTQNAFADTTLSPSNCNGGCQDEISRALSSGGPVVTLTPGIYWIDSSIAMPPGATLQGTRTGRYTGTMGAQPDLSTEAVIKMRADSSPLIGGSSSNVTIQRLTIDGNCDALGSSACYRGTTGNVLMYLKGGSGLVVTNMYMRDAGMDGVRLEHTSNITFSENVVWRMGHEALYALRSCSNVKAFNNEVMTWTNSAFRMAESYNGDIHHNTIYSRFTPSPSWTGSSTGPGIEINESHDVNIHHNTIQSIRGSGIWVMNHAEAFKTYNITIACNNIQTVGKYKDNSYSSAGVMVNNANNVYIKNNIIRDAGNFTGDFGGAIQQGFYRTPASGHNYKKSIDYDFSGNYTTFVTDNIFINNVRGLYQHPNYTGKKGQYFFESSNNCFENTKSSRWYVGNHITATGDRYSGCATTLECTATLPVLPDSPTDPPPSTPTENCSNAVDDDGDTFIDCGDTDCKNDKTCMVPPYNVTIDSNPVAIAGKDLYTIIGRTINLDGSRSVDDKGVSAYSWDFDASNGIQSNATGATATATYNATGKYIITLTVTDTAGKTNSSTITVTVCGREADADNDGFLNATCGGGDCDDNSSSVRPGSDCLDKCFGDAIMTGKCQENGQCSYDTVKSTCTNLGSECKLDRCDDSSGIAVCITDFSADFCGGLIPCGRELDNPTTENNEQASCSLCHIAMLSNNSIQYLIEIASILALLALMISGMLYVMSAGNPEKKNEAKGYVMATIKGFAAVFLAWLIVDFILSAWGFIDPLGGNWNVVCDLFLPLFR